MASSSKTKDTTAGVRRKDSSHHARKSSSGVSKNSSKSKEKRGTDEHSFLTDVADVRQMEHGLMQLLDDFHSGTLQAFGEDCSFHKLDQVREQQEKLARLHFELDVQHQDSNLETEESREKADKNLDTLMDHLQELCTSVQNLQKDEAVVTPR